MSDIHPDVQAALDTARALRHRIADMRERLDSIRARRPSPGGDVIPEVDSMGRLTDLYVAPGTTLRYTSDELVSEIMAAITESTADAARQHRAIMNTAATGVEEGAKPTGTNGAEVAAR
ncbi:YbaB/EbfC family nucleoid-associated protein [Nocardia uniformis]|uniref:YbaB/EbfC family nucleoid-associated protein n=1 Tax=Nocardia uniformis TaxID=53432 RepID=UPI0008306424|nr:YbaB/EbfC family nucleoid-associated protein [Nocardia uniformis]